MEISDSESINLQNAISILNSEGEKSTPYTLTIKNICDTEADYQVNIETLDIENKLADQYVTLKVNNEENKVLSTYSPTDGIIKDKVSAYKLYEGHLKKNQVMNFEIRMWIGEEVEATDDTLNKLFQSKVTVEATVNNKDEIYKEDILNGADPVLKDNLIPVTIDDKGEVYRANLKEAWYNYADKIWANAVILEDGITIPEVGAKIEEEQIESYFVWIPKYSYQLWDLGNYTEITEIDETKPHTIPIRFGTSDTSDEVKGECETPMNEEKTQGLSGGIGKCQIGDFMTHPAFISFDVNGLWVGKFETGYKGATTTAMAQVNPSSEENAKTLSSKVIIKPNTFSWRNIQVANAHIVSYNYQRDLDSHMMKNTEWGAVAYLTNSKYGRCNDSTCEEVRINNNSALITGYAATEEPTKGLFLSNISSEGNRFESQNPKTDGEYTINYLNPKSTVASTTGNYSGIYDMNGGANEYTIGIIDNKYGLSGFDENNIKNYLDYKKYFDIYDKNSGKLTYKYRILGDATSELGPFYNTVDYDNISRPKSSWYNDFARFLNDPLLIRGGHYYSGINSGIFGFLGKEGANDNISSFRIVLAPKQG